MKISIDIIKKLRSITDAGLGDCKEALTACSGDIEKAKNYLREKGVLKAYKKSQRDVNDGLVAININDKQASIIQLNSETDFVARNKKFQDLALKLVELVSHYGVEEVEEFLSYNYDSNISIKSEIMNNISVIGENINLSKIGYLNVEKGVIGSYVHNCVMDNIGKAAAIVALSSDADELQLKDLAKNIAMHIVAAKPDALSIELLDKEVIDQEYDIITKQVNVLGKSENVVKKIIEGRMQKFFEEIVLLEQVFIMDGKTKISDLIRNKELELKCSINILGYRFFSIVK
ncbi:elongation factor Ts [Neoehrlichia mikurensis]|uniref:Elongation factor Ts n=1 Tax=Neoehrlichia mikurensis TaxID=89586 RepID=A0A9Q9BT55_9RICK|nr:translation elongation factor Ts [Neoehrlichia mikurensis]QXK91877.1 elongation factor Ts [Neoehrlichia mikurensis]QXK93090.1 elongation factor Ts [Neoehrlichia mikurensis]QXK93570.1 elongation factor Ts [Neoehrlichia mikurensis]UTO55477.1 translation elongation factor Ts [Neoehrlichia mikurensis]UTO56397.1 translation elongation factor Ts [Neoehrlichia mikurensis]